MLKGFKSAIKWIAAIVVICAVFVFLGSINGLNVTRTIITVDGSEITEQEYKFYVEVNKMQVLSEQNLADEDAAKEFLTSVVYADQGTSFMVIIPTLEYPLFL